MNVLTDCILHALFTILCVGKAIFYVSKMNLGYTKLYNSLV